ncbi:hypothetical protein ACGFNU_17685 [Spirillospora sp. NPDC048911]|uniref:hypothetical protein n=1 Tax=Spirillospora sp. NPDC048911 TaxID=3364527 RepID=UPI00371142DE
MGLRVVDGRTGAPPGPGPLLLNAALNVLPGFPPRGVVLVQLPASLLWGMTQPQPWREKLTRLVVIEDQ